MFPKISACCFIRDNNVGAFGLWESMASLMPLVDEYLIMDCESTDGTLEILRDLAAKNPRIRIVHGSFMRRYGDGRFDNRIFADLANELVAQCRNDIVLYHQADEIFHEQLIKSLWNTLFDIGQGIGEFPHGFDCRGLGFIRYQLQQNFQEIKWWPHVVKRLGLKSDFKFVGDGMNAENYGDAPLVGGVPMCNWQERYKDRPASLPTGAMILDISMTGGFLDNILMRRQLHAPLWNESPDVLYGVAPGGVNIHEWMAEQEGMYNWTAATSPFNIPAIMRGLVGFTKYFPRQNVLDRIANDKGPQ